VVELLSMLDWASMRDSSCDMVRWSLTTIGKFIVKSFFFTSLYLLGIGLLHSHVVVSLGASFGSP